MRTTPNSATLRAESRKPITSAEVPFLEALGADLRAVRTGLGITRVALADAALIGAHHLYRIEIGVRRTRPSTLARIADGLAAIADPDDEETLDPATLVAEWVELAGPALAAESPWQARIERRARRRHRQKVQGLVTDAKVEQRARLLAERMIAEEEERL